MLNPTINKSAKYNNIREQQRISYLYFGMKMPITRLQVGKKDVPIQDRSVGQVKSLLLNKRERKHRSSSCPGFYVYLLSVFYKFKILSTSEKLGVPNGRKIIVKE